MKVEVVPELAITCHWLVKSSLNFDLQRWMLTWIRWTYQDLIKRWSYVTHHTPAFHNSDERQYNPAKQIRHVSTSKFKPSVPSIPGCRHLALFIMINRLGHQRTSPSQGGFWGPYPRDLNTNHTTYASSSPPLLSAAVPCQASFGRSSRFQLMIRLSSINCINNVLLSTLHVS